MAENEIDRRDAIIQMKGGSCVSRKVKQSQMDDLMFFVSSVSIYVNRFNDNRKNSQNNIRHFVCTSYTV